ncbi:MAG TPA: DUF2807 domain-containing protein [Brevundimonas sp.]|jgi:hypothetical protein
MIRTLLIIAGAAFVLALASLAGGVAVGGRDMARHGWEWTFPSHGEGGDLHIVREDGTEPAEVTRTLAWAGGDKLVVDLDAADVEYVQGDTPGITVRGRADRIDNVRIDGDRLSWAGDESNKDERLVFGRHANRAGFWVDSGDIHVVVTSPAVKTFEINGSADVAIKGYDQPSLTIASTGSGDVSASGATKALALTMTGSGDADLSDLLTEDAEVDTSGSGDATIAPTGAAVINLSGSGDLDLATRPSTLRQSISGSGDVRQD